MPPALFWGVCRCTCHAVSGCLDIALNLKTSTSIESLNIWVVGSALLRTAMPALWMKFAVVENVRWARKATGIYIASVCVDVDECNVMSAARIYTLT